MRGLGTRCLRYYAEHLAALGWKGLLQMWVCSLGNWLVKSAGQTPGWDHFGLRRLISLAGWDSCSFIVIIIPIGQMQAFEA